MNDAAQTSSVVMAIFVLAGTLLLLYLFRKRGGVVGWVIKILLTLLGLAALVLLIAALSGESGRDIVAVGTSVLAGVAWTIGVICRALAQGAFWFHDALLKQR